MGSRGEPVLVSPGLAGRLFHFVMIKPTHYDDDGYPIGIGAGRDDARAVHATRGALCTTNQGLKRPKSPLRFLPLCVCAEAF